MCRSLEMPVWLGRFFFRVRKTRLFDPFRSTSTPRVLGMDELLGVRVELCLQWEKSCYNRPAIKNIPDCLGQDKF